MGISCLLIILIMTFFFFLTDEPTDQFESNPSTDHNTNTLNTPTGSTESALTPITDQGGY
jgi:hypothetical protein